MRYIPMSTRGPARQVDDAQLLAAVAATDRPFATAKQIADSVDLSTVRVKERMNELAEKGDIRQARVGNGPYIYWDGHFSDCDN